MIAAPLSMPDNFAEWRAQARRLAEQHIPPEQIVWQEDNGPLELFAATAISGQSAQPPGDVRANLEFLELARSVILHRSTTRLDLLYRVLWRLQDNPRLLEDQADDQVIALHNLARQVRRDVHKMRAFVRFRTIIASDGQECFVAWFEPEHRIERFNARFFVDRFGGQQWSILTPRLSLHWDGEVLSEGPGAHREDAPPDDATEELWLGYYRSIFNPARLKVGAMLKEMPRRYWKNLPEAVHIPDMIATAQARESAMIATGSSPINEPLPQSLDQIADRIGACQRCPLGCNGTRAVMGEGPLNAALMIIGEQPGDVEEQLGRPFVGPAGQLLDSHLDRAGIDRSAAYVTNAVKHFKYTPSGKRRLHQTPNAGEIDTCRWWVDAERALVRPRVTLVLGASAGRAVMGRTPAIGRERGAAKILPDGGQLLITAHPSYLLRLEGEARDREEQRFAEDLTVVAGLLSTI